MKLPVDSFVQWPPINTNQISIRYLQNQVSPIVLPKKPSFSIANLICNLLNLFKVKSKQQKTWRFEEKHSKGKIGKSFSKNLKPFPTPHEANRLNSISEKKIPKHLRDKNWRKIPFDDTRKHEILPKIFTFQYHNSINPNIDARLKISGFPSVHNRNCIRYVFIARNWMRKKSISKAMDRKKNDADEGPPRPRPKRFT